MTRVARNVMRSRDALADFAALDSLADLDDLARDLVSEHQRRFLDTIPLHHVAAAYAAGLDAHEQLAGPDLRRRHLLEPHVAILIIHRHTHA